MTDEHHNIGLWRNAVSFYTDQDERSIYSRIGARRQALSSYFPGAMIEGESYSGGGGGGAGLDQRDAAGGSDDQMPTWQKWFTFLVLPAIIALLCYCVYKNPFDSPFPVYVPTYNATLENLQHAFPSQPVHVWTMIQTVRESASKGRSPGVITILANVADKRLLNRFATSVGYALANLHSPPWNVVKVNGSEIDQIVSPKRTLMLTMVKQKRFVAVVNDLDKMNASFVSLFHSVIDDMSWFNGSIFIFTLTSPENVQAISRDKYDIAAERVLNEAWSDQLPLSYRSALVARLTSNTLVVRRELEHLKRARDARKQELNHQVPADSR